MKIQITLTLDLGDNFIDTNDTSQREWLFDSVLNLRNGLFLHSNEVGDSVGEVVQVNNVQEVHGSVARKAQ